MPQYVESSVASRAEAEPPFVRLDAAVRPARPHAAHRTRRGPAAERQPATGVVTGRVTAADTQEPVVGAIVRVLARPPRAAAGTPRTGGGPNEAAAPAALTDAAGRFVLRGVAAGVVRLEARRIGYVPLVRADVAVSPGRAADVAIALAPAATALAAAVVRPGYFPAAAAPSAPVSTQTFTAEEVRRTPGAQEDVVRTLSVLPGVSGASAPNQNGLVVRGGAPAENLFLVDNVEVPNINHFGTQGSSGGAASLLNVQFVREASLSAGGFGARYGDRTASVTVIQLADGSRARASREVNLSAIGGSAVVQGPLGAADRGPTDRGPRVSYLAAVRRSYLDVVFEALGVSRVPSYADAAVKVTAEPGARDRVSAFAVGAADRIRFDNGTAENRFDNARALIPRQDQYFGGVTWQHTLRRGSLTATLGRTWTRFSTVQADTGSATTAPAPVFAARSTEGETSLRADLAVQPRPGLTLEAGNVVKVAPHLRYAVDLAGDLRRDAAGEPRPLAVDTSIRAVRTATYAQVTRALGSRARVTAGLRGDYYAFIRDAVRVAPRLALALTPDDRTTVTLAGGRYWQAPPTLWLAGDPGNARTLRPWRADQAVLGLQRLARPDLKVQVEAYVKRYAGYPARVFRPQAVLQPGSFDDASSDVPFGLEPLASAGSGTASGVEGFVQKRLSDVPIYGALAVSLSRTRFRGLDGVARRGAYDAPVVANALVGWRPGARWEFAGRARFAAGLPTTPYVLAGPLVGALDFAGYNAGPRLPGFFTADLRADRRFVLGRQQFITYVDVQNATNRSNTTRLVYNGRAGAVEREANIGVLPTVGVNWQF